MTTAMIDIVTPDGSRSGDIALRGIRVVSRLAGLAERTRIEQTFANRGEQSIEPIYTFPLPDGAAVCGFEVITDERVLTGVVDEQEQAQKHYEEAIERGDGAYLLEQERGDIFTVRVGALRPGQVATLRLEYVRDVQVVDRQIRLDLPTTLAPRYAGSTGMDPMEALLEADAVNPPKAFAVPYGVTFELDVELGRAAQISSPTHQLSIRESEGPSYHVSLEEGEVAPDRSIVVALDLQAEDAPRAQLEIGPDGARYAAISFLPDLPETLESEPAEIVFVVDCSGSMDGPSIEQARQAMELCLRAMKEGDRFRILRFGSSFEELTDGPTLYGPESFSIALEQVRAMEADLGGTELHAALAHIFATASDAPDGVEGRTRQTQVLLLTDGEVFNEDETIALARQHADRHRIFSFGIGAASSQTLVHGLARVSRGAAEFIAYDERIEDKVLRTFSRLDSPRVEGARLEIDGVDFELASSRIPAIFDGDALLLLVRLGEGSVKEATLRCRRSGEEWESRVALAAEPGQGNGVPLLWAQHRIRELEDAERGTPASSRFARSREEHHASKLVELSRRFGIVCSKTAFFAVEHRRPEDRTEGMPELQRVPLQLAHGWHGLMEGAVGAAPPCAGVPAPEATACDELDDDMAMPKRESRPRFFGRRSRSDAKRKAALPRDMPNAPIGAARAADRCKATPETTADPLLELLGMQEVWGYFEDPSAWIETERLAVWRALGQDEGVAGLDHGRVLDTLMVLALLLLDHQGRRSTWLGASLKARRYLGKVTDWEDGEIEGLLGRLVQAAG
jgi:Ca-activated chloride channel family protein